MESFSWPMMLGGIAFFFYGLRSARKGLEAAAGDRIRAMMSRVAGNRVTAFAFGAFVTFILQSSGATSAILVSFTEMGISTLQQATAMLLGADIGTSFVVILLSIEKLADMAIVIIAVGFAIQSIGRRRKLRDAGSILLGFGLIFYGIHLMSQAAAPLSESPAATAVFAFLAGHPLLTLVAAAAFSSIVHSAGMIGIAIALAFAGTITLETAVPIVLGANLGSCATAVMASLGGGTAGRRVALAHTFTKLVGVTVAYFLIPQIAAAIASTELTLASQIAATHVLFNVALALLFLPLIGPLTKVVELLLPMPPKGEEEFAPKYLDEKSLDTPTLAFAEAKQEIMRLASVAQEMFENCLRMFSKGEDYRDAAAWMKAEDDKIDRLEKAVRFYLAEIATERLTSEQAAMQMALFNIAQELEEIGDTMSREMAQLSIKKARWHRLFSDEGWRDLRNFQAMIDENFELMMSALAAPHEEILKRAIANDESIGGEEQRMRQAHFKRLHEGLRESFETSSIHLDILADLRHISTRVTNIIRLATEH